MIDTGTSLACMPNQYYLSMVAQWQRSLPAVSCEQTICYVQDKCENIHSKLDNITIGIGTKNFVMKPEGYLLDASNIAPEMG